jgi:DeoR/GlpR family transcriptional regulator of sugar metabolism
MTVHRDLDDLERQGVLRKVRNGATSLRSNSFESDVRYRLTHQMNEKRAIAQAALNYIEPGQAIFLDEATTLVPLAERLPELAPLTVITNFLPIIQRLVDIRDIRLITLGGEYLTKYATFTGIITERVVRSLRADIYLTSVTATSNGILFHPEQRVLPIKQAMMANATQNFILLDHTKFGKVALHSLASINEFDLVVVDSGIDKEHLDNLYEIGTSVEIADVDDRF